MYRLDEIVYIITSETYVHNNYLLWSQMFYN